MSTPTNTPTPDDATHEERSKDRMTGPGMNKDSSMKVEGSRSDQSGFPTCAADSLTTAPDLIELARDLQRRAEACYNLREKQTTPEDRSRLYGKGMGYEHAATLVEQSAALSQPDSLTRGGDLRAACDHTFWERDSNKQPLRCMDCGLLFAALTSGENDKRIAGGGCWPPPDIRAKLAAKNGPALPLNWRTPTDHPQDGFGEEDIVAVADGIGGRYSIRREGDGTFLLWFAHDEFIWLEFSSLNGAKVAAEVDWQERFAAKTAPSPTNNGAVSDQSAEPNERPDYSDHQSSPPEKVRAEDVEPNTLAPKTIRDLVAFWFEPWGAWKSAVWEDISGDAIYSADSMMDLIRTALKGQADG